MMCQRMGFPPSSIIGFGRIVDSSLIRVPRPPARITAFMLAPFGDWGFRQPIMMKVRGPNRPARSSDAVSNLTKFAPGLVVR